MTDEAKLTATEIERNLAYHDPKCPPRACDHCGKTYQGPAVYCSFDCAIANSGWTIENE